MYDKELLISIFDQIFEAIEKIESRTKDAKSAVYFTSSVEGMEKLDGICMLFIAIGESLKNVDKITGSKLFPNYPDVDWAGVMKLRDIVAHHYFDIDADQIYWIIENELYKLKENIKKIRSDISGS
ncbi:MAG TPA: DUF86 domain-containing protein [bacterium]|jgi:uncharacterized protein with HEPN domain|nr:DUF86 domain-containing protein [bacterium]MDX9805079.1 DUF86 domain-containing protein [bacterium]HNZ53203.1 DUF86 domain-containing protein [bacterium]HOG43378.1 DUF86 domain-containing protein [bacterium]HPG37049.1 DUF86 domain-containing protein [bacterium]